MKYKVKKHHIHAVLAAMTVAAAQSAFAAAFGDNLQDNSLGGTTYVSTQNGEPIRFGQVNTTAGGGATTANTAIAPTLQGGGVNLDYVYTSLQSITPTSTSNLQGGLVVDPATGNVTVAQGGTQVAELSANLISVRRLEVYNQNEANSSLWGQAVDPSGVVQYGYVGEDGSFVEVPLSAATVTALENFAATPDATNAAAVFAALNDPLNAADLDALSAAGLYSPGELTADTSTGNLTVEGTITQGGVNVATVDDVATSSTALQDNIDAETAARIASDDTLQASIDAETTRATGAEAALQGNIDAEVATRESLIRQETDGSIHIGNNSLITNEVGGQQQLYAQDAGGNAIDINVTNGSILRQDGVAVATVNDVATEAARATAAETVLDNKITAETTRATARENQIEADSIARDNVLDSKITAETTRATAAENALGVRIDDEAATRAAADTQLQANIDSTRTDLQAQIAAETTRARSVETALDNRVSNLESRASNLEAQTARNSRDIKTLRRGVSMAAALQTPVIGEGKNNAAKIGVTYFDGETGLAAGYARRLNDSVTVNAEVATTDDFDDIIARAGLNYTW